MWLRHIRRIFVSAEPDSERNLVARYPNRFPVAQVRGHLSFREVAPP